jgi:hypothetical protein
MFVAVEDAVAILLRAVAAFEELVVFELKLLEAVFEWDLVHVIAR